MGKRQFLPLAMALAAGVAALAMFAAVPAPSSAGDPATAAPAANAAASAPAGGPPSKGGESNTAKAADGKKDVAKETAAKSKVEPADNSYCLVCHMNYETEKLTRSHQIAGVGCAKCHGESEKHSGDEDGLTPPDVMFTHSDVDGFCMTCHPKEKIAKNENHKDIFSAKAPVDEHLVCAECHGENHRMAVRTRTWDKKTRKLISDDGVRMMYKDSPATSGVKPAAKKSK
jgi:hypothetical protein